MYKYQEKIDLYFKGLIESGSNFVSEGDVSNIKPEMVLKKECSIDYCNYWNSLKNITNIEIIDAEKNKGYYTN